ncbi:MAG: ABC-2 family transporter protein [Anaerolineaceae bacterium]|nr:ABC-2 family transporter protein [Anaerolineaceae bacterium]
MPAFLRVVRLSFQQQLTYRAALLSGLAANFFFALLRTALLVALYGSRGEVNQLSLQGAITYVAVSQAMIAFLFIFGTYDVMATVYSGSIGADLLKPLHLFNFWMARDLGRALVNFVGRGVLLVALFALVYPLQLPQRLWQWLGFTAALGLGWLLSFTWRFLVNLAAFWTPDARGVGRVAYTFSQLLSGFIMPLRLYPDWFTDLCKLTPFPSLFNTSTEIFLGLLSGKELWLALLNQAAWLVGLGLLTLWLYRGGVRRLVIQGG